MDTEEDNPAEHDYIEEIHYVDECCVDDTTKTVGVVDGEDVDEVLLTDCLHCQVECE